MLYRMCSLYSSAVAAITHCLPVSPSVTERVITPKFHELKRSCWPHNQKFRRNKWDARKQNYESKSLKRWSDGATNPSATSLHWIPSSSTEVDHCKDINIFIFNNILNGHFISNIYVLFATTKRIQQLEMFTARSVCGVRERQTKVRNTRLLAKWSTRSTLGQLETGDSDKFLNICQLEVSSVFYHRLRLIHLPFEYSYKA